MLFGLSYGLVYPALQAIAVNLTPEEYRSDTISYFSLLYFIGLYSFPPVGGFVIVHYGYPFTLFVITILSSIELGLGILLLTQMNKKYIPYVRISHLNEEIK
jgi:MFS family permease